MRSDCRQAPSSSCLIRCVKRKPAASEWFIFLVRPDACQIRSLGPQAPARFGSVWRVRYNAFSDIRGSKESLCFLLQVEKNVPAIDTTISVVVTNPAAHNVRDATVADKASVGAEMAPINTSLCAVDVAKDGRHSLDGKDGIEGSGSPYNQLSPINPIHLNDILQGF